MIKCSRNIQGLALCGLERFDEVVRYYDEMVEISDYWKNNYSPTFSDLSNITCSTLINKALIMENLKRQAGMSVCYNKIIEISEFLLSSDKGDLGVIAYRARVRIRKGEIHDLLNDLSEFLTKCPQDFSDTAKERLHSKLKKERGFEEIKNILNYKKC